MTPVERRSLDRRVEEIFASKSADGLPDDTVDVVEELLDLLERGHVRAATRSPEGKWSAVPWVKRGILLAFRAGVVVPTAGTEGGTPNGDRAAFFDKHTLPVRRFGLSDGVRIVPGGSSIRDGSYVSRSVTCMPPMYINVGAYVGAGTMVDSHALVGSCAQIGERCHLSAAAQIGGVLEPIGAMRCLRYGLSDREAIAWPCLD